MENGDTDIPKEYLNKDGLVRLSAIEIGKHNPYNPGQTVEDGSGFVAFKLKTKGAEKRFYPTLEARGVVDYLIRHPELLDLASVRVDSTFWSRNGAAIFGVKFDKALEIVLRERFVKSLFYALDPESLATGAQRLSFQRILALIKMRIALN